MKICDNCGKKLNPINLMNPARFPMVTVEIVALDQWGTKQKIDLCQQCQNDIYNNIMNSEVQNIDSKI